MYQFNLGHAQGTISTPLKRPRDQESDSDEDARRYPGWRPDRRAVLDGIKRMRVSSPIESSQSDADRDCDMADEKVTTTPRFTYRSSQAIVPSTCNKRPLQFITPTTPGPWKLKYQHESLEVSTDDSCRAMVVFNPYSSMSVSPIPRVEIVEQDNRSDFDTTSVSESEEEQSVRFEELPSDNDEPVDMDID
ncbi:hypothetical protein PsorP6_014259 [Peronosclerospora sorghi]|uniref:Uncharacterized protein n=1 Tax=Peronosclerospora sorghi TaxID=230839 RepID=A0ACC0VHZ9_9STRA|nr:hypothetical protein PsorP6_014259 [Peronosclerospora sorghi]